MSKEQIERDDQIDIDRDDDNDFPKDFRVLLLNDNYTTMEFVIFILQSVFGKSENEATQIMLNVHNIGFGECGVYTYEIAVTKQQKVMRLAKENGHPLKCSIEEV